MTSASWIENLVTGKVSSPFILLKRMPDPVSVDRFMKSPVLEFKEDGTIEEHEAVKVVRVQPVGAVKAGEDALSKKSTDLKDTERMMQQKVIID